MVMRAVNSDALAAVRHVSNKGHIVECHASFADLPAELATCVVTTVRRYGIVSADALHFAQTCATEGVVSRAEKLAQMRLLAQAPAVCLPSPTLQHPATDNRARRAPGCAFFRLERICHAVHMWPGAALELGRRP